MPPLSEVVLAQLQVVTFLIMCGTLGLAAMHRFALGTSGDPAAANAWLRASIALSSGLAFHSEHFDVQLSTDRGVLLTLKAPPARSSAPRPDRSALPSAANPSPGRVEFARE
jgi:hypothetical protein